MKNQAHLTIAQDPLAWDKAPPVMYGECRAEVLNPMAVDTFTVDKGIVPDFDPLSTCAKCVHLVSMRKRYDEDDNGEATPAPFYVYAIADRKQVQAHENRQHSGEIIEQLERTVAQADGGLLKTSPPVTGENHEG